MIGLRLLIRHYAISMHTLVHDCASVYSPLAHCDLNQESNGCFTARKGSPAPQCESAWRSFRNTLSAYGYFRTSVRESFSGTRLAPIYSALPLSAIYSGSNPSR
eukprot:IDg6435t1